jgi:hypothetical protein
MTAIEQAEELRQKAISLLIAERDQIEERLIQLGYGQEKAPLGKKRGRKPKNATTPPAEPLFRPDNSPAVAL